mgnify:CR=1 FL=1
MTNPIASKNDFDSIEIVNSDLNYHPNGKRKSIKATLLTGLSIFFALFLGLTLLTFVHLTEFRYVLKNITEESIPSVIQTSQTYSQVNSLISLTERLIKVNSESSKRATTAQIQEQLLKLKALSLNNNAQSYLATQLKALTIELEELDDLIVQRLENKTRFDEKLAQLYSLFNQMPSIKFQDDTRTNIAFNIANIFAVSGQLAYVDRLHLVRQLEAELKENFAEIDNILNNSENTDQGSNRNLIMKLNQVLLAPDGLVQTRIKQLRIEGRSIGRGNFMRNLIIDYANQAEYQSFNLNTRVMTDTRTATEAISAQLTLVTIAFVVSLIIFIFIVYYLQKQVVARLIRLNVSVNKRLNGSTEDVVDNGTDEISDIAETFNIFANTVELQKQTLEELSSQDGLTGINNRRAFDDRLTSEIYAAQRHNCTLSLLIIDVDFFKPYNDNYGHAKGDECLKQIAQILSNEVSRETDFIARYGGEEFACILPVTDEKGATLMAKNLIKAVYNAQIPHSFSEIDDRLTISIGIAVKAFKEKTLVSEVQFITEADSALYQSKLKGRNRYTVNVDSLLRV